MTDLQMMTLAFAVLAPLSPLLLSNSRVTDAKETLRSDIRTLSIEIQSAKTELKQDLTIHVLEHHK